MRTNESGQKNKKQRTHRESSKDFEDMIPVFHKKKFKAGEVGPKSGKWPKAASISINKSKHDKTKNKPIYRNST